MGMFSIFSKGDNQAKLIESPATSDDVAEIISKSDHSGGSAAPDRVVAIKDRSNGKTVWSKHGHDPE